MPNILFKCRSCGNQLVQDDTRVGVEVTCQHCGSSLTVPKTTIVHVCPHPHCSQAIKIDIALKGDGLRCPSCTKSIMLPLYRANVIVFLCKRCEQIIEIPNSDAGKLLPCPKCNDWIRGPDLKEIAETTVPSVTTAPAAPLEDGPCAMSISEPTLAILVVDDNQADQQLMANHLQQIRSMKRGIAIDFAKDGAEAVALLRKKGYALVVLDWNLPVLGQGDVLRYLRKHGNQVPVVVVSGVEPRHLTDQLVAHQGTFLSKDKMSPETFHVAICMALALINLKITDFFDTRT